MTEEEAYSRVTALFGQPAADRLERMAALVLSENHRQNLIAKSTIEHIWGRHVLDSVQLVRWAHLGSPWLDVGTGGGFPGLAIACVDDRPMILLEPRRRRAEFLSSAIAALQLGHVQVVRARVDQSNCRCEVISARAVMGIENLLRSTARCATPTTRWLLPRGRFSAVDLAVVTQRWKGSFHVEHSLSDADGRIVVAEGVAPR